MGELIPFPEQPRFVMTCAGCGADRTVPPQAADPGPCKCGSTSVIGRFDPIQTNVNSGEVAVTVTVNHPSGKTTSFSSGTPPAS